MPGRLMPGVTFDAGGLIALDRDDRRVVVLLARARETGAVVTVPATALAQAIRRPERQARLARLIRQPGTDVHSLDRGDATSPGRPVVLGPRRASQPVVTSDPGDLSALDPAISLITI